MIKEFKKSKMNHIFHETQRAKHYFLIFGRKSELEGN